MNDDDARQARLAAIRAAWAPQNVVFEYSTSGRTVGDDVRWLLAEMETATALAASSAEPSTVTTRTITIRCHCGRGVTIGPDPWCEGCVQSAATCDCVPATQGRGDA